MSYETTDGDELFITLSSVCYDTMQYDIFTCAQKLTKWLA